ncbi:hypothetical protein CDCA_CDCA01G0412 [Cyanidium caldarium]|uniref:Cation-transporting ATPase n=1 Tax=Cyanidium caldarium TaxID=2771 RepID=A0AAV9IPW2_CYACA|nr:hypothetical protein CDCA_CDCA01G0412 [Cyanidium caldarium]
MSHNAWCAAARPELWVVDDDDAPGDVSGRVGGGGSGGSPVTTAATTTTTTTTTTIDYGATGTSSPLTFPSNETAGVGSAPGRPAEAVAGDESDASVSSNPRSQHDESLHGFEAYTYARWRLALYALCCALTLGMLHLMVRAFPNRCIRLLGRRARSLIEADVLLVRIRRLVPGALAQEYVLPVVPITTVPHRAFAFYLAGWWSHIAASVGNAKAPSLLPLLSQPPAASIVIEVRQRRFLLVELAQPLPLPGTRSAVRYVGLRVRCALAPHFDDYYEVSGRQWRGLPQGLSHPGGQLWERTIYEDLPLEDAEELVWPQTPAPSPATPQDLPPSPPMTTTTAVEEEQVEEEDATTAVRLKRHLGLSRLDADIVRLVLGRNRIEVEVPPLLRLFVRQLVHPFFIFQWLAIALWILEDYYLYSATIAAASLMSALLEATETQGNARRLARIAASDCEVQVWRRGQRPASDGVLERISSSELVPGDVFVIESGMTLPCDCTLLSGSAVVTEASLTGEASPLFKSAWRHAFEDPHAEEGVASPRSRVVGGAADEDDHDSDEEEWTSLQAAYFSGAYSLADDSEELLPTPAYHHLLMSTGLPVDVGGQAPAKSGERMGMATSRQRHRRLPEHYTAWDHAAHMLYCGTRVIEARVEEPAQRLPTHGGDAVPTALSTSAVGVLAVAVHTRMDTAKGTLMRDIFLADDDITRHEAAPSPRGARRANSALPLKAGAASGDRRIAQMYDDAYQAMKALCVIGFLCAAYSLRVLARRMSLYEAVLSALDVVTIAVPPALPAAVTFGIVFAIDRLLRRGILCIRPPAVLIAAGLDTLCFDKTGTLTDLGLDVYALRPVQRVETVDAGPHGEVLGMESVFAPEVSFHREHVAEETMTTAWGERRGGEAVLPLLPPELSLVMSSCHTLTVVGDEVLGDEVDSRLFELTGRRLERRGTGGGAVRHATASAAARDAGLFTVCDAASGQPYVRVAKVFEFSSELSRMGVVAQVLDARAFPDQYCGWVFLVKGAPEVVLTLCDASTVPRHFGDELRSYTARGLRVLALAGKRLLPPAQARPAARKAKAWTPLSLSRRRLEKHLELYGLAVLENRLKPETAPVLEALRLGGGLRCPMVTGDHIRTAISVARQAGMIESDARVVIADEDTAHRHRGGGGGRRGADGPFPADAGQVVFFDSTNVAQRYSRMEMFRLLLSGREAAAAGGEWHGMTGERPYTAAPAPRRPAGWTAGRMADEEEEAGARAAGERTPTLPGAVGALYLPVRDDEPVALAMTGAAFRLLSRELRRLVHRMPDAAASLLTGGTTSRTPSRRLFFLREVFLGCAVFARMSADDKSALVRLLRTRLGVCVGMCGDGANDASALREADVGISLCERRQPSSSESTKVAEGGWRQRCARRHRRGSSSSSSPPTATASAARAISCSRATPEDEDATASLAAPFTSTDSGIRAAVTVVCEGRGAAAASVSCFKYMGIYSLTQSTSILFLYRIGSVYSDGQFLFQDLFLIMPLALAMGRTASVHALNRYAPPTRLASWPVCVSLAIQGCIQSAFQAYALWALASTATTTASDAVSVHGCRSWNGACAQATTLFLLVNFQYIWTALAFNIGFPFRRSLWSNRLLVVLVVSLTAACSALTLWAQPRLVKWFRLFPLSTAFRGTLQRTALANGAISLATEWLLTQLFYRYGHRRA